MGDARWKRQAHKARGAGVTTSQMGELTVCPGLGPHHCRAKDMPRAHSLSPPQAPGSGRGQPSVHVHPTLPGCAAVAAALYGWYGIWGNEIFTGQ